MANYDGDNGLNTRGMNMFGTPKTPNMPFLPFVTPKTPNIPLWPEHANNTPILMPPLTDAQLRVKLTDSVVPQPVTSPTLPKTAFPYSLATDSRPLLVQPLPMTPAKISTPPLAMHSIT